MTDRCTEPGARPDPSAYEPRNGRMEQIRVEDIVEKAEQARATYGVRRATP